MTIVIMSKYSILYVSVGFKFPQIEVTYNGNSEYFLDFDFFAEDDAASNMRRSSVDCASKKQRSKTLECGPPSVVMRQAAACKTRTPRPRGGIS